MEQRTPERIRRLRLLERVPLLGRAVLDAERELQSLSSGTRPLNLTHADTKRFPPPPQVLEAFIRAARGGGEAYTAYRGDPGVRAALAPNLSQFLGVQVDPERDLILTPGSQAALFLALATTVEQGDTVLLADPDYLSDERIVRFFGGSVIHVPLRWTPDGSASLDLEVMDAGLRHHPSAMLLSNPNNPTGAVYPREVVRAIANIARERDLVVIVDELYARLRYDGRPFYHLIAEEGMRERCITLVGPSKTESMSGYRVGAAVAPPRLVDDMEDLLGISVLRAPAYAQHTLVPWLAEDQEYVANRIIEYQRLRDQTLRVFAHAPFLQTRTPQGTAYAFPSLPEAKVPDQEVARRLVIDAGVIVNPGYQFGPAGGGGFRICFAQEETVWASALGRIVEVLAQAVGG